MNAGMPVLLKAYQPPEDLAACREGDLYVAHNLTDKCAYTMCRCAAAPKIRNEKPEQRSTPGAAGSRTHAGTLRSHDETSSDTRLLHAEGASWRAGDTRGGGGWP